MLNSQQSEKSRPVIDLDSLELDDAELVIDPNADPDARLVPPEGKYLLKLGLNENNGSAFTAGKDKRGRSYIMANLVGTIVAEGAYNRSKVFDSRSTLVLDSSGTCGMAAIPRALKLAVPANTTKQGLAKLVQTYLQGEPLVGVELRWESRYQDENGIWKTFKKGMRNYPEKLDANGNPTGQYIPETEAPDGQTYPAKLVVVRYMPADEVR